MGWCSGSEFMLFFLELADEYVDKDRRQDFIKQAVYFLEDNDWDCQEDVIGEDSELDEILEELHPDWFDLDEEDEE